MEVDRLRSGFTLLQSSSVEKDAMALTPVYGERTINELSLLFKNRQINLEPGFQRQSVWTINDRRRLMQSIFGNYPLPSIFLYRREAQGRVIYDVIDGKQRLESIFMFSDQGRFKRERFDVKLDLGDGLDWWDWRGVRKYEPSRRASFESYKLQTVEVTGDLSDIVDLFVRINSTGKRLTSGEKRHARFYKSPFLLEADHLVQRYRNYVAATRILSPGQIDRMKATELFAELLMSLHTGAPINKKTSLDRALGNDSVNGNTLHRIVREFKKTMNLVKKMLPELSTVRMRNSAEFYSLFLLVWQMDKEKLVLADRKRNRIAFELLKMLSNGVDALREQLRKARPVKAPQRAFQEYLLTVQGDTDSAATRERRGTILRELVWSVFERKDVNRGFSAEQRRPIWHRDEKPKCAKCGGLLGWADFTIDHVKAWSKGGSTSLANADLMHRSCNSSKGAG
jgi:hypothetical protein